MHDISISVIVPFFYLVIQKDYKQKRYYFPIYLTFESCPKEGGLVTANMFPNHRVIY